jgi:hypothetical protein
VAVRAGCGWGRGGAAGGAAAGADGEGGAGAATGHGIDGEGIRSDGSERPDAVTRAEHARTMVVAGIGRSER